MMSRRNSRSVMVGLAGLIAPCLASGVMAADGFSIRDVLSAPFPSELTAASRGNKAVWVSNDRGSRNLWVSEAAAQGAGGAHAITHYTGDDGVDIGELRWLPDASAVVYTRGGSFEGGGVVNALSLPQGGVEQELMGGFRHRLRTAKVGVGSFRRSRSYGRSHRMCQRRSNLARRRCIGPAGATAARPRQMQLTRVVARWT